VRWIGIATWWAALLPLAALAIGRWRGRRYARCWWWLASGYAVSWVPDALAFWGRPGVVWIASHVYPVAQAGAILSGLARRRGEARWLLGILGAAAWWSLWFTDVRQPGVVTWVVGALLILWLLWRRRDLGLGNWSLLIYFGLGLVFRAQFWWAMETRTIWTDVIWLGYQGCRLTGLGLLTWAVARDQS
jgi:hypothetical protein